MTVKRFHLISSIFISTLSINSALALPIDWTGAFGVDTHMLSNTCRTSDDVTKVPGANTGTQGIGGKCGANFQTYVFKLNPQIIVNDGVTLKGELSSGYLRGGFAGGEAGNNEDGSGNNSYFFTSPAQRSALNVNQMYMELYADTALVKIGRMSKHYGLGIMWDAGNDPWDRFFTMYDGIEAEMKISNFSITPYYAKISSYKGDNGQGSSASGEYDVREMGITAKYDNKNRDLVASVLYAKRSSEPKNTLYNANTPSGSTNPTELRGKTDVTVIEPYISKKWNKFKVAFEASLQTGDYGNVYQDGTGDSKLAANAYILEAKYDNKNRDLVASVLYAKRSSEPKNTLYNANTPSGSTNPTELRGKTDVTVIEPYISKKWNKFKVAFEASLQTGDYGNVYQDGTGDSKLAANAYILEAKYDLNPKWDIGFTGGQVSGDKGDTGKFEAAYLHPNYQVADLMFRYNYAGFTEGNRSVFDSSIMNTRFYKINANYKTDKWVWKGAFIMATAMETAQSGKNSYHHEENYRFVGAKKQDNDLGMEFDFGFDYKWNPNVTISGYYGYWKVGDYYAFSNSTEDLSVSSVHGGGLRATLEF